MVAKALTNAVKHADASTATVRIQQRDGAVHIEVTDDGRGGDVPAGPGLQGLADRLAALGGRLELHSPPGKGTTLATHLPCA